MFDQEMFSDVFHVLLGVLLAFLFYNALAYGLSTTDPIVTVVSHSMEPTLQKGDMLLIRGVPMDEIKKGDIIVYFHPPKNRLIVHRVFAINDDGTFKTKGDNQDTNPSPDPWDVQPEWVRGRMITGVPLLGYPRLMLDKVISIMV